MTVKQVVFDPMVLGVQHNAQRAGSSHTSSDFGSPQSGTQQQHHATPNNSVSVFVRPCPVYCSLFVLNVVKHLF